MRRSYWPISIFTKEMIKLQLLYVNYTLYVDGQVSVDTDDFPGIELSIRRAL